MQSTNTGSQEKRAQVVAGIRALADLIERDTTLPVPQAVNAQFSIIRDLTEEDRQLVRDVAAHLGIDPAATSLDPAHFEVTDERATLSLQVAGGYIPENGSFRVVYVVHGRVDERPDGES